MPRKLTIERFLASITIDTNRCWLWTKSITHNGYARFASGRSPGHMMLAHVYSYEYFNGPIDKTLTIHHTCSVTSCVNPDHLEQISLRSNILLGTNPAATNAKKTHCSRGHPFNKENTYVYSRGRMCKICNLMRGQVNRTTTILRRIMEE